MTDARARFSSVFAELDKRPQQWAVEACQALCIDRREYEEIDELRRQTLEVGESDHQTHSTT